MQNIKLYIEDNYIKWYKQQRNQINEFSPSLSKLLPNSPIFHYFIGLEFDDDKQEDRIEKQMGEQKINKTQVKQYVMTGKKPNRPLQNIIFYTEFISKKTECKNVFLHELIHLFEQIFVQQQKSGKIENEEIQKRVLSLQKNTSWTTLNIHGMQFKNNPDDKHSNLYQLIQYYLNTIMYKGKNIINPETVYKVVRGKKNVTVKQVKTQQYFQVLHVNNRVLNITFFQKQDQKSFYHIISFFRNNDYFIILPLSINEYKTLQNKDIQFYKTIPSRVHYYYISNIEKIDSEIQDKLKLQKKEQLEYVKNGDRKSKINMFIVLSDYMNYQMTYVFLGDRNNRKIYNIYESGLINGLDLFGKYNKKWTII